MPFPIADSWFEKVKIDSDVTLIFEPHVVPLLRCNIWHVRGRDRDLIVDTGTGLVSLTTFAKDILGNCVSAVATHVHLDHIGCHHEFKECLVHTTEAEGLINPNADMTLVNSNFDPCDLATLYLPTMDDPEIAGPMVTAIPYQGFNLQSYKIRPAKCVSCVGEGDIIDLGNRVFEVLHLPGHSPGSIGLWEAKSGTLFSGDAVYDGPLIDDLHHSDRAQYEQTMFRLRKMPISKVHGGHDPSFGYERLHQIIDEQLRTWESATL